MQQFPRQGLLGRVSNPYFRQTLIRRNFTGNARQKLSLNGAFNSPALEFVYPHRRYREVRCLNPDVHRSKEGKKSSAKYSELT